MGKGLIAGIFWGALLSVMVLGMAAVIAPPPERPVLPDDASEAPRDAPPDAEPADESLPPATDPEAPAEAEQAPSEDENEAAAPTEPSAPGMIDAPPGEGEQGPRLADAERDGPVGEFVLDAPLEGVAEAIPEPAPQTRDAAEGPPEASGADPTLGEGPDGATSDIAVAPDARPALSGQMPSPLAQTQADGPAAELGNGPPAPAPDAPQPESLATPADAAENGADFGVARSPDSAPVVDGLEPLSPGAAELLAMGDPTDPGPAPDAPQAVTPSALASAELGTDAGLAPAPDAGQGPDGATIAMPSRDAAEEFALRDRSTPSPAPDTPSPRVLADPSPPAQEFDMAALAPQSRPDTEQPAPPSGPSPDSPAPDAGVDPAPPPLPAADPALEPGEDAGVGGEPGLAPAPRVGLPPATPGVETSRLPRIGDDPEVPDSAGEDISQQPAALNGAAPELSEDLPAMLRNAVPFENPEARPLFAIILIDDGIDPQERENLARLPFPVTFAVDPARPDAAQTAALYRAQGKEVLMLASAISLGAGASDPEVNFRQHFAALPQAVGVLDMPEGGFQDNRLLVERVVGILAAEGFGLVTFDRGLNAAEQVARSAGLGAGRVYRLLDAEDENSATIRRYLDRAVFRAGQEGAVIVLGRGQEETLAGILEWRMEGRADAVAIAPISAVLTIPQ